MKTIVSCKSGFE